MKTIKSIWNFLRQEGKFIALQTLICGFIITIVIITMTALFTGCSKSPAEVNMGEVFFTSRSSGCAIESRSPSGCHDVKYRGCTSMNGCDGGDGREFFLWTDSGSDYADMTLLSPYTIAGQLCEDPLSNVDYHICDGESSIIILFLN